MAAENNSFVGSIPEYYDKYLGPLIFEEYSIDFASRINVPQGGKLLEIAAGTGLATRHIKNSLPKNATITVTDLNEPMLEIAKSKFSDQSNMHFQFANAIDLPFENEVYDSVVCQYGIMFFPDKQKGVNEAFRVLKPGGEYIFSVWDSLDENPIMNYVNETLIKLFGEEAPPFLEVPFHYHKLDEIRKIVENAGFGDIDFTILPRTAITDNAENVPLGFIMGNPLSLQIPELGGDLDEVMSTITKGIEEKFGPSPIKAPMKSIVIKAIKP